MLNPIRLATTQLPTPFSWHLRLNIGHRSISVLRFRQQAVEGTNQPQNSDTMEKQQPAKNTGDVMDHSFGEGYATRSDEEGFGGTCALGGDDAATKIEKDKMMHANHPAYDKTQGNEVAEEEKGRHQKTPC